MNTLSLEPYWMPVIGDGTHWKLVSHNGRYLGCVLYIVDGYSAKKLCCGWVHDYPTIKEAALWVLSVLHCTECRLPCPASASN